MEAKGYHVHVCVSGRAQHEWLCHGIACAVAERRQCPEHQGAKR